MTFSRETLMIFAEMLGKLQISPTHPEAEATFKRIRTAHDELQAALKETETSG